MSITLAEEPTNPTPDRFWFKVFNEVLHDMVFIDMPNQELGVYVRLLALANSTRNVGQIAGNIATVTRALRLEPSEVEYLHDLDRRDLIIIGDGVIAIAEDKHYEGKGLTPSDSREAQNERKRRSRRKFKSGEPTPSE
jgi:hypothetical protein